MIFITSSERLILEKEYVYCIMIKSKMAIQNVKIKNVLAEFVFLLNTMR